MMICYKFPDQATFHFLADDMFSEEDTLICYTHDYSIHEIGSIVVDDETVIEGHHVNYMGVPPESWEPYRLRYVDHPSVVFAGTSAETEEKYNGENDK